MLKLSYLTVSSIFKWNLSTLLVWLILILHKHQLFEIKKQKNSFYVYII